jgi:heptosyltransferase-2
MTTPALQRLRQCFPHDHIALLTLDKIADLWLHESSIDQVIPFSSLDTVWSLARRLREGAFDQALVFPNSPRSTLEMWLAHIPERIGFARPWRNWFLTRALPPRPGARPMQKRTVREIRRLIANHQAPSPSASPGYRAPLAGGESHHIHDYLHLAAAMGADPKPLPPRLQVTTEEIRKMTEVWLSQRSDQAPTLLGMNPSAAYGPAKRWPASSFAAVAREISKRHTDALWLVFGAANDFELCREIINEAGVAALNLAGKTSLRDLMALLSMSRVVLTNDSGPMHLAAALGTPVVVPFGSTSPELTGPGLPGAPDHQLLVSGAPCAPCYRRVCPIDFRCMHSITVDVVAPAVLRVLETRSDRPVRIL